MWTVSFELEITLDAAWQVGTGMARGLLDRTTRRNARGEVYIPASTIKGRLRNACEHIARLYSSQGNRLRTCQPPKPQEMCRGAELCIVCRLFGSAYAGERLFFEDAMLRPEFRDAYDPADFANSRTRVKVDRRYGIAEQGHLYTTEYAEKALSFRADVSGRLPLTPLDGEVNRAYELILLAAGVRMMRELGGDKSAGFGVCEMSFASDIKIGEAQVSQTELLENWLEYLEFYGTE
jgi:CRISPR/Cas system CSM-associated protein Csm3 (group 7 of RAMP superfamily)